MPALHDITIYFDTNATVINATVSLFIVMNAIAPLFLAPLSERVGRRWVYIICMAIYTISSAICGIAEKLGTFFVFRLIQGIFGSVGPAIGGGTVADLFEKHERGRAMGIYILGMIFGPSIAPVIGGYTSQYLGWRWIFYLKTIIGGVLTILTFIFVKETLYRPGKKQKVTDFKGRLESLRFNPFASLQLLKVPGVALTCLAVSVSFGWYYYAVVILPATFSSVYGFSEGSVGLCYLSGGVGSIMYGWFIYFRIFWFAPIVGFGILACGTMFTLTNAGTYLVEAHPQMAASGKQLLRSTFTYSTNAAFNLSSYII
ncbi:hypothetical protein G6F46_001654 [Rhizopus delemar]|uniref:Major facilitator superfamily (MFS) profile domain-containing protein n=2 Tax=Rhizopus TaxID=4842 RepID=A0A9P7CN41_9FUNG|nr:hypothetical protein G6F55_001050 [Rhizopus delemar]KAG1542396.1 hypothetical protein G6F51_007297 [Rhizopus arrhizus]KAG1504191.1 hypothetical protein G6F54_001176 [Rhizopus delemar]KAG1509563.1 hypothetical protein G6F53_007351 [Rhizopus delemar]KAG1521868.1 hypothetical protein G6F52_006358 [Rhizopus delemar]